MELNNLKVRLQMPLDDETKDALLTELLSDAVSFVESVTQKPLQDLPQAVNGIIVKYIRYELQGNTGVLSETIGGMTQTFESSEARDAALSKELQKIAPRKVRFHAF